MSDALTSLQLADRRLAAGEPVRILIGHTLHDATEIVQAAPFARSLRLILSAGIARQIADLSPPDPEAPQGAMPVQRSA